jgi:long-subunit fatty acid transport protein
MTEDDRPSAGRGPRTTSVRGNLRGITRRQPIREAIALVCALAASAVGSPRSDPTTGRAVFTGATLPSATSILLDPAAIGLGTNNELYLASTAVIDRIHIDRKQLDLDGNLTEGGNVRANELGPGAQLAFIWRAIDRVTLGVSFGSPPSARFPDNKDPLRYHVLGGSHRDYLAAIAASFKVTDDFYFGVSAALDDMYLHLHYLRDTALEAGHGRHGVDSDCGGGQPCGIENPAAAERYDIHVKSLSPFSDYLVNLGLVYQVARDVWLGVAYHTAPGNAIESELHGTANVTLAPRDGGQTLTGGSTAYVSLPASVDAEVRARLRRNLDLHVGMRWEDLSRFTAYDVRTYGSSFIGTDVAEWTERARGMHDPFSFWVGVEQVEVLERKWYRFGARIGYETSSVSDARVSPLTIAPASATLDLGAQLRLPRNALLEISYGLQYFLPVDVTSSAFDPRNRIACIENGFDYSSDACAAVRSGYAIPSADGLYNRVEHAIRFAIRYELP